MANAPMKPVEAWAVVNNDTGEMPLSLIRADKRELERLRNRHERLVRVVITEKEASHA